ncbi:hypothetical protein H4C80_03095 [Pseudomonas juntendi]|uniref:Uncharacterized protein n=1 Tax=Pseudomonas juntendi TaxID=2666183 RepID=A0A7W2KCS3_9PSED|nr:DUF5677 domain-containing protein [Pseudomonas juntendi]MBA6096137.1 hypothetical protein [Pseudomonas juntendi]MBA6127936.1 hypothetical protein [Pseudomonas juntendi]MBA6127952.1 hypothetical protein [Pseudomonas juntendi]
MDKPNVRGSRVPGLSDQPTDNADREPCLMKNGDDNLTSINEDHAYQWFISLDLDQDSLIEDHYNVMEQFRERLFDTWKTPLKRLDSLLYISMEIVDEIRRNYPKILKNQTNKHNIATRLHARCVQIGNEISQLLHGGFADGAFSRWRTLHETAVTTKFISEGDEDLATRFKDYQSINRFKVATHYNSNNELQFEKFSEAQLASFESEKKEVLKKYESYFSQKFGWATKALGKRTTPKIDTTFHEIEKFVGLSYLKNHFNFASQYVHAGIDSIGYKLGTSISKKDILLTGPSNEGLIEPIQCTSLSIATATTALLKAYPHEKSDLKIEVIRLWHEKIKEEVLAADAALQARGAYTTPP